MHNKKLPKKERRITIEDYDKANDALFIELRKEVSPQALAYAELLRRRLFLKN